MEFQSLTFRLRLNGGPAAAAQALDDGRYSLSPLKPWFDSLRSGKGPCCSDADGFAVTDPDWESKSGHYPVPIDNEWIDVPDDAVITEPNRAAASAGNLIDDKTAKWTDRGVIANTIAAAQVAEMRCGLRGKITAVLRKADEVNMHFDLNNQIDASDVIVVGTNIRLGCVV